MKLSRPLPLMLCLPAVFLLSSGSLVADDTSKDPNDRSSVARKDALPPPPPGPFRSLTGSNQESIRQAPDNYAKTHVQPGLIAPPAVDRRASVPPMEPPRRTPPAMSQHPLWPQPQQPQRQQPQRSQSPSQPAQKPDEEHQPQRPQQPPPASSSQRHVPPNWMPRRQYAPPPNYQAAPHLRQQQQWGNQRPQQQWPQQQWPQQRPQPQEWPQQQWGDRAAGYPPPYWMPGPSAELQRQPPAAYWQQPYWGQRPPAPEYRQGPAAQWPGTPPPRPAWGYSQ